MRKSANLHKYRTLVDGHAATPQHPRKSREQHSLQMLPSKRKAAEAISQNEGAREILRGQGERMLEVVLETYQPHLLAELVATPLESAAARKDDGLSRKLAALRDRIEGAHEAMHGEGEKMLELVLETTDPHRLAEWLAAVLECAAAQADEDLSLKLVQAGANVRMVALYRAIRGGSVKVVDLLLENGASAVRAYHAGDEEGVQDLDEWEGEDPLGFAANHGNVEIARSLMRKGACADYENGQASPLLYAIGKGDIAMVEAFLEDGVDLNHRVGEFERSPLEDAAASGAKDSLEILRMIINHGAQVNSVAYDGQTALHVAAKYNNPGAILLLVEAGVSINKVADMDEWQMATPPRAATPLHAAAVGPAPDACLCLLECGADVNAKTGRGRTALHLAAVKAAHKDAVHVVDLLLRRGADERVVCDGGKTAKDVVGTERVSHFQDVPGNIERVRSLLARAPADRAWRRRGIVVLCRAYPDRVRLGGDLASLAAAVLGLVEDGVFRKIVGYL